MQKNREENFTTIEVDPITDEHYIVVPEWVLDEKDWGQIQIYYGHGSYLLKQ